MVFLRLNTGSVQLSPQELRQALHPGAFSDYLDDASADSESVRKALRIRKPDFRMRDVELLLRYYAFRMRLQEYRGNLKAFLDATVELNNRSWEVNQPDIRAIYDEFNGSIETAFEVFSSNAFFRWDGKAQRYERRFNRALFDAVMFHFADGNVRSIAVEKHANAEDALKRLCESDVEFVRSIQVSTKTVGATFYRIKAWGDKLGQVLDKELHTPTPVNS
jgi:hypothetical protein